MSLDHLKLDLNASLIASAERTAYEAIRTKGAALPCTIKTPMGPLVEVTFNVSGIYTIPSLIVPVFGVSQYIRQPLQVGDMGVVFPLPVSIASVTGQGSGAADLTKTVGPMSALTFLPGGNANWPASEDAQKLVLYGPNGAVLRTMDSSVKVDVGPGGVKVTGSLEVTSTLKVDSDATASTLHAGNGKSGVVVAGGRTMTFLDGVLTGLV